MKNEPRLLPVSSSRQSGISGFERICRISLRATRLEPIFAAEAFGQIRWDDGGALPYPLAYNMKRKINIFGVKLLVQAVAG